VTRVQPRSVAEVSELLRSRPGRVRLVGSGSRQDRRPDPGGAVQLDLAALAAIVRLDAPDQTCTVECGVPRDHLDGELARHGLELPCPGGGTLGGLFASDPIGAAGPGGASPRSLLLGMDAVLADGTPFRCGARVVKSVAGFDVHKLLVGSAGRLFAATRLHLRLKPQPRTEQWFAVDALDPARAMALLTTLREQASPPATLQLLATPGGPCSVRGRIAGRERFVAGQLRRHGLAASEKRWLDHLPLPAGGEVLTGLVLPSVLPRLLAELPPAALLLWHGGGRWETALPSAAATDSLLTTLAAVRIPSCIVRGDAARRGVGTPVDPGLLRLDAGLQRALDPHGILV
jgi:glycolate oxidase FAD binding subunit